MSILYWKEENFTTIVPENTGHTLDLKHWAKNTEGSETE